jgi:uncharacterized protein YciI
MYFHIQLIDNPATPERRAQSREAHWDYFDAHADHFVARGATTTDDGERTLSSVLYVEFDDLEAVRHFVNNEPHNLNGVFGEVRIWRWHHALDRTQREFPRKEGQVCWYIRGFGKQEANDRRNELADAHRAYFADYDAENFIVRGGVRDQTGELWEGSANLIALPSRGHVDAFLAKEPFYSNGLYDKVLVERYKFGGRPGQIV